MDSSPVFAVPFSNDVGLQSSQSPVRLFTELMNLEHRIHQVGNAFGLLMINLILIIAFSEQWIYRDEPCPLCLLQRIAFIMIGLCLCMNLKNGVKPAHYGLMILSALTGFAVALRQLFLHLTPGDKGYGPLFFHLHLYTWSLIVYALLLGGIAVGLLLEKGLFNISPSKGRFVPVLMYSFLILILMNGISTLFECGIRICAANP